MSNDAEKELRCRFDELQQGIKELAHENEVAEATSHPVMNYLAVCNSTPNNPSYFEKKEDAVSACVMAASAIDAYHAKRQRSTCMSMMQVEPNGVRISISWGSNYENSMVWNIYRREETKTYE